MPEENIPGGNEVISMIKDAKPLTEGQKQNIDELFNNLEVTHEHMVQSYGMLGILSWSLTSRQLLLLLKASVHPIVQVNAVATFLDEPSMSCRRVDLPESRSEWVKITMIPDPTSRHVTKEKPNSPTHLLVAVFAF